ncbi:hypothetical protein L3X38_013448 [Prunus dulcis]|uniref:Leucine-rich repeat-containing N-terminal plant-type domain-containing protein n=1 Tax=Prunus dulcis TaxID=3755 RepID=A0AAD4WNR8_PRUDU|nr:hypothetical protein L3X38_013448 [Prunus dulcis]
MQGHGRCLKLFLAFALLLLQYAQGGEVDHSHRDTNVTGRCTERERQALLAFKRGLVDKSDLLSSWGKMISPKLIELHYLEHLDLGGINFIGIPVPDFIGSLSNLRYLDLSWTYFGGKFPSEVGNLTNLKYLALEAMFMIGRKPSISFLN